MKSRVHQLSLPRITAFFLLVFVAMQTVRLPTAFADTPDEQFQFASGLYDQKLWGLAATNLAKFLAANPNDAHAKTASYQLGTALYRATDQDGKVDYTAAATAYEKALARFPDPRLSAAARYELGDIYYKLKQFDKAIAASSEFLKTNPALDEAAEAQYTLGESYYAAKKSGPAKASYQAILTRYPQSRPAPYAARALGYLAEDENDFESAAAAYTQLLASYPKSDIAPEARLRLANAQLNAKKYTNAITNFQAIIADATAADWKSNAQIGLADANFGAKNWSAAAKSYRDALANLSANDNRRKFLQLRLGDSHYNAKEYDAAFVAYAPITSDPDATIAANALYFSGGSNFALKKFAEAATQYKTFLDKFSTSEKAPGAALRLGDAYAQAKNTPAATQAYRDVLSKYPQSPEAKEAGSSLLALASQSGDFAAAAQAVKGLPPGAAVNDAQLQLAQLAFDNSNWSQAVQLAEAVLAAKPAAATAENALYLIAASKLQAGDAAAAEAVFQKQLTAHPTGPMAAQGKLGLAWTLIDLKKWSQAETAARDAFAAAPTSSNSKEANLPDWSKLALGQALLNGGKAGEASALLASLESSTNKDIAGQATQYNAVAFENQKQWSQAAAEWTKYATLVPDALAKADAQLRAGLALVQAKQTELALKAFDAAVLADPNGETGARALYESAWAAHDARNNQETARWQRLETEFPKSKYAAEAAFQEGENFFDAKTWDKAAAAYSRVTQTYGQSEIAPLAWYKLGSALYNTSDWKGASAAFDKSAGFSKSDVALESSFWAAESLRQTGDLKSAQPRYENFIKGAVAASAPETVKVYVPAAHLGLGKALLATGDAAGATAQFQSGLAAPKGKAAIDLQLQLGISLMQQKKYAEASSQFLKIVTLHSDSPLAPQAQWNAILALEQSGDSNAANKLLKALTEQQPENEWTRKAAAKMSEQKNSVDTTKE